MTTATISESVKIGRVNIDHKTHDVFASARAIKSGGSYRPFIERSGKQQFLSGEAKEEFQTGGYFKEDRILYLENLSRLNKGVLTDMELTLAELDDSREPRIVEESIKEKETIVDESKEPTKEMTIEEVLQIEAPKEPQVPVIKFTPLEGTMEEVGEKIQAHVKETGFKVDPVIVDMFKTPEKKPEFKMPTLDDIKGKNDTFESPPTPKKEQSVEVITEHTSTPFNIDKAVAQAKKAGTPQKTEYILIREYDRVKLDFNGDLNAYLAAGNKKTDKVLWERIHVTDGVLENGTRLTEKKELWFKFHGAAKNAHENHPGVPIFKYRDGRFIRIKKIKA